jgi:O-antigen/teichoic acid export membrane protein
VVIHRIARSLHRADTGGSPYSLRNLDAVTQGWLVVTSGSAARLGLGFIASIIIARALGPAAFGVYAVLAAIASFTGAAIDHGLTKSAVRRVSAVWPENLERALEIWRVFLWLRVLVVAIIVGAGLLLAGPISSLFLDIAGRELYLRLALLGVAATALSGSLTGMLQATSHFGRLSAVLLVNSGLTVILAIGLALAGQLSITTALLVLGIGTSLVSIGLAWWLLPGRWTLSPPNRTAMSRDGRDLARFGAWLWIGSLFGILALYLDVLIVNHWLTAATVGVYALAVNLAIKVEVVNHSLYTVLLPAASSLKTSKEIRQYIRRGLIRSGMIGVALVPLIPLARPLITLFYGESYAPAAGLFQGLLLIAIFNVIVMPLLMLAFTFDRPRLIALSDGLKALTLLVLAVALIPHFGTSGAIVAKFIAAVTGSAVVLVFLWRELARTANLGVKGE